METPASRRTEHVADTRTALITAARRLFAEQGYAATGTEEIVVAARVTRGALYHHFRDKAALFREVMQVVAAEVAQRLIAQQLAPHRRPADAWEELRAGVRAYLEVCADGDFPRIVLIEGPAVLGPAAWQALVNQHGLGLLRDWLRQAVTAGEIDPLPLEPLARLLAALLAEASLYIASAPDPLRAREETGPAVERILLGLRPVPTR